MLLCFKVLYRIPLIYIYKYIKGIIIYNSYIYICMLKYNYIILSLISTYRTDSCNVVFTLYL